ncbi:hypothetical protein ACFE04_015755 [Oxalis oulophora]
MRDICSAKKIAASKIMAIPHFPIFVNSTSHGKTTAFVRPTDTIDEVRKQVFNRLAIPLAYQSYVFEEKHLTPQHDLGFYGVQRNSTLQMAVGPKMTIMYDDDLCMPMPAHYTVLELKLKIQQQWDLPVILDLYYNGTPLQNDLPFGHYKIPSGSSLRIAYDLFN